MDSVAARKIEIVISGVSLFPLTLSSPVLDPETETRLEDMPSLNPPGDDYVHYVRSGHRHAVCGIEVDLDTLRDVGGEQITCPACHAILRTWLEGKGWEGFGDKPPSPRRRKELADLLGE